MTRPYLLLRAGFPYHATLGMRRMTTFPVDIAIGKEGRLYVLCRGEGSVLIRKMNWDDEELGAIGGPGTGEGQFLWPVCVIADEEENLYVSDEALNRISIFDREGNFLASWGEAGSRPGQLNRPSGLAFDPEGNIYVSDTLNHRVQKFTRDGGFLAAFGEFGDGPGQFNMPWGLAVDEEGSVYVADWRNDRVQKFDAEGRFIMEFGGPGSERGRFRRPAGVCVDAHGDIYVADVENHRVQQFDAEGRYVDRFLGDATLGKAARIYMLANPKPLRLREMTNLEEARRLRGPLSVRIDDEFRLYIVDHGSHRIQVYKKEAYPLTEEQAPPPPKSPTLSTV